MLRNRCVAAFPSKEVSYNYQKKRTSDSKKQLIDTMVTVTIAVANLWKGGAAFGHSLPHVRNFQIPTFIYKNAKQQQHPRIRIWISSPTLPTLFSTSASTRSSSFCTHVSASDAAAAAVAGDEQAQIMDAANLLDIRVGRILKAWRHAEADSLYVEEVDVGEPEPRLICSGLVNYIPLHHLQVYFIT